MFILLQRFYATIYRAYDFGGFLEVIACIKDGCTTAIRSFFGSLAPALPTQRLWPAWSPELLAYRPYREGRWAGLPAHDSVATFHDLFACVAPTAQPAVPLRSGAADVPQNGKYLPHNFQLPSGAAEPEELQYFLRVLYGEPQLAVRRSNNEDVWNISFSDVPQRVTSIIIPTRDRVDLLDNCMHSIQRFSKPGTYEIIVIDNGSVESSSIAYLSNIEATKAARVVRDPGYFNWSRLNNIGAKVAMGETYLFLNNDIEVLSADWLTRLSGFANARGIGCVGPMLLYADRTIQHAGVVVGMGRWADHIYKFANPDLRESDTPFVPPAIVRPVLALTGACLAVSRKNFMAVGGFDEGFSTVFSDTDFCVRLHNAGFRNIYLGDVQLLHFESKTRDPSALPVADFRRAFARLEPYRTQLSDPYFHPDLSRFSLIPRLKSQRIDLARWTRR